MEKRCGRWQSNVGCITTGVGALRYYVSLACFLSVPLCVVMAIASYMEAMKVPVPAVVEVELEQQPPLPPQAAQVEMVQ